MDILILLFSLLFSGIQPSELSYEQRFVLAAKQQRGEPVLVFNLGRFVKQQETSTYEERLVLAANRQREEEIARLPEIRKQAEERRQQLAKQTVEGSHQSSQNYNPAVPYPQSPDSNKTVHVNGYYRKDGTYVQPYYRSPPRHR